MKRNQKYALVLLAIMAFAYIVLEQFYFRKKPTLYPNFGIEIPSGYSTHGIDVSRYQKDIDWDLVSKMTDRGQHISFAIIKATEGVNSSDSYFNDNWENIKDKPLLRGAYLYFHPNRNGKSQAQFFIKHVALESGDLPPIIDIEEANGMNSVAIQMALKECALELEKKYKHKPILYSNVDFYENKIGTSFDEYPLWVAHYEQKDEPKINRKWLIWQHNCKGHVNGIDAEVDFNVVNGSLFALRDLCL